MSKFKVGDRVRLLSDATEDAKVGGSPAPSFGRKGQIGTVVEVDRDGDLLVDSVDGWFCAAQLEHADPKPPVAHHDRVVADTHAAIDRLVAHLERQATEHVHALDALRAEVESLRTQNAHLRALQAATEAKPVGTFNGDEVYVDDSLPDGTVRTAKPVREVVRGLIDGYANMSEPGSDANRYAVDQGVRQATEYWHRQWMMHDVDGSDVGKATETQAIAWVLDGVLPAR